MVFFQRLHHTRRPCRLHSIYFNIGTNRLNGKCHSGDKSAAAHGHNHSLHIGHLVKYLKTYSALPRYHKRVIERMHKSVAMLVTHLKRALVGIVIYAGHETHLGSILLGSLNFGNGGTLGQTDNRFYTVSLSSERDTLRMISCRACNYAMRLLLRRKLGDFVIRATKLK